MRNSDLGMRNFRRLVPVEHQPQNFKDENIKHRVTEFAEQTKKQNTLLNPINSHPNCLSHATY